MAVIELNYRLKIDFERILERLKQKQQCETIQKVLELFLSENTTLDAAKDALKKVQEIAAKNLESLSETEKNEIVQAWVVLGLCYGEGFCIEQNYKSSFDMFQKAAEQDDGGEAQFQLGNAFYYSRGVEEDENRALEFYDRSARQGHAAAYRAYHATYQEKYLKQEIREINIKNSYSIQLLCNAPNELTLKGSKSPSEVSFAVDTATFLNKHQTYFSTLKLDIPIGTLGLSALLLALIPNTGLTTIFLDRSSIELKPEDGKAIAELLEKNNTITSLEIDFQPKFGNGVIPIAKALKTNTGLTSFYLDQYCAISLEGAKAFAEMIASNTTLTSLGLEGAMGVEGVKVIAKALENNCTLTSLYLDLDVFENLDALATFEQALQKNRTLTSLHRYKTTRALSYDYILSDFKAQERLHLLCYRNQVLSQLPFLLQKELPIQTEATNVAGDRESKETKDTKESKKTRGNQETKAFKEVSETNKFREPERTFEDDLVYEISGILKKCEELNTLRSTTMRQPKITQDSFSPIIQDLIQNALSMIKEHFFNFVMTTDDGDLAKKLSVYVYALVQNGQPDRYSSGMMVLCLKKWLGKEFLFENNLETPMSLLKALYDKRESSELFNDLNKAYKRICTQFNISPEKDLVRMITNESSNDAAAAVLILSGGPNGVVQSNVVATNTAPTVASSSTSISTLSSSNGSLDDSEEQSVNQWMESNLCARADVKTLAEFEDDNKVSPLKRYNIILAIASQASLNNIEINDDKLNAMLTKVWLEANLCIKGEVKTKDEFMQKPIDERRLILDVLRTEAQELEFPEAVQEIDGLLNTFEGNDSSKERQAAPLIMKSSK